MTQPPSELRPLLRAATLAGVVCSACAAAWFLPMRGTHAFTGEAPLRFAAHVALLCLVVAGTGAIFGWVAGIFTLRFGTARVALVAAGLGLFSSVYTAWRQERHISHNAWLEGSLWAFAFAALVAATGAVVRRSASGQR